MTRITDLVNSYASGLSNRTIEIDCDGFSRGLYRFLKYSHRIDSRRYRGDNTHAATLDPQPISYANAVQDDGIVRIIDLTTSEIFVSEVNDYRDVIPTLKNLYGGNWREVPGE